MASLTLPAGDTAGRTRRSAGSVLPGRDEAVDAVALITLTMIGIAGFRPAYGGHGYLAAGAAGVLLGLLLSHAGQRARVPLLGVVAAGIIAFLLFGGLIGQTGTVSLPVLRSVAGVAVSGWQQLLTTARPVGRTAGLLVLPYLLGLFSGVAGHALARRTALTVLPAAPPAVVVALSILFGAARPTAAVLQGAGFAAGVLAWGAARQQRGGAERTTVGRQRPWQRIGAAVAVLAVAGAGATVVVGPHLPGADAHQRVVLYVEPPFDVSAYPSPLAGFRDYTQDVPGRPQRLRHGTARHAPGYRPAAGCASRRWTPTTGSAGGSPTRRRTRRSAASSGSAPCCPARYPARRGPRQSPSQPGYTLPWLPDLAGTTGFGFTGPDAAATQSALRFNVATTTGIIPGGVPAGLSYTVSAAAVTGPSMPALAAASPEGTPRLVRRDPRRGPGVRAGALRLGDHATRQGPRARRVPARQRAVQQRRRRAERDHRRAQLGPAHLLPRGQADHRRRRAVRRRDGAARGRGRRPRPGQP